MTVRDMVERFGLAIAAGKEGIHRAVRGGYCGDLLSDVMAHAPQESVWLTVQGHQNVAAVAALREMAAVIVCAGHVPDEELLGKADREGIPILLSPDSAFHLAGGLYEAGVGRQRSEIRGQRSEVGDQRSEIRGQRSEIRNWNQ